MTALISLAGLPATGKTTIGKRLSIQISAVYLRVDEIEAAMRGCHPDRDIGPDGYHVAAALAASNLGLGHVVIIDCVNPWSLTRELFRDAARRTDAGFLGVEVSCSDPALHRTRAERRDSDIPGLELPDWQKIVSRDYHPWTGADLRIDTARIGVDAAVAEIVGRLGPGPGCV